jgi:hypothetical protein
MIARRLWLTILVSVCGMVGVLAAGAGTTSAAQSFGGYGEEAEQLRDPTGVAVDATGDVYVGDLDNNRIDKFEGSGGLIFGLGAGVATGAVAMQTCTIVCRGGDQTSPVREGFELPSGVAVDDDPLSSSYGDVYVVDTGHTRVEKFGPSGNFILMIGGHVNETTGEDVCRAGEICAGRALPGTADGEFSGWTYTSFIAVGPGGAVYVGDKGRVEVFESSGTWRENISLAGLSATASPTALAVDAAGDLFVKDGGVAGVHEFEPDGTETSTTFDAGSSDVTALAVDSPGHLYVGDSSGGFHVLEFNAAGVELSSFGFDTLSSALAGNICGELSKDMNCGLAFSNVTGQLYASEAESNPFGKAPSTVWVLTPPPPGPLIDSESATPEPRGAGILEAMADPENSETTYHFEYVSEAQFEAGGYASATSTTAVALPASFDDQAVSADFAGGTLAPGVVYHYRLVARDAQGHTTVGADQVFQEIPAALIQGPWSTDVAGTSATVGARIDPQGASTSYRVEYGTSTAYGQSISGVVGEGSSFVTIAKHIQELEPATTYHYRIVATNEVGTWQSADHSFTTQAATGEFSLPDGRAWELVSPVDGHGALIVPELNGLFGDLQAASDGSGIAYVANQPVTEGAPGSYGAGGDQVLSVRSGGRWVSQEVGTAEKFNESETASQAIGFPPVPAVFSSDLSEALVEPGPTSVQPLSSEATERTLYLRDDSTGRYLPLVTPANVPAGTKFGGGLTEDGEPTGYGMTFLAATPDLSHIVLKSPLRLTPEAVEGEGECPGSACPNNLYEWSNGQLALVDVLPNGEPLHVEYGQEGGAYLGRTSIDAIHAISNDGRRIVWARGGLWGYSSLNTLYVRDMVEEKTWQIGGPTARFETMSGNGSRVFYWEGSELYAFDVDTDTTTDVTAGHGPGEHRAGVKDGFIMAASEEGEYVYYVATGVLASGAVSGEDNLYVSHYDGAGWTTTLIATLAKVDQFREEVDPNSATVHWEYMAARVSPNGRYLAFMSSRALTGYDNSDAVSEQPDEEVYLYDATANRLVCASCSPSGARPIGVYESNSQELTIDDVGEWTHRWLAADIPGWRAPGTSNSDDVPPVSQPRYLSDSGRLFFNSVDALVPQDTNGVADVYEYEPVGVGSCASGGGAFSERSDGCVSLISSGTAGSESAFMDASENGDDVFFTTASSLVPEDVDTSNDVYDAHVCSAAVPCTQPPVLPPPCTSGDSCKAAPMLQPEIFGAPSSATFSGSGNVPSVSVKPSVGSKSLSRAEKLARALKSCRAKKRRRQRTACERQARRLYRGIESSRKASARQKGRG